MKGPLKSALLAVCFTVGVFAGICQALAEGNILQDAYTAAQDRRDRDIKKDKLRLASRSAERGKALMALCLACHNVREGEPSRGTGADGVTFVGPHLQGIVGREIGGREDFRYSPAFAKLNGRRWTEAELVSFLKKPERYAPGTSMKYEGVGDPQDLLDIITYLKTLK